MSFTYMYMYICILLFEELYFASFFIYIFSAKQQIKNINLNLRSTETELRKEVPHYALLFFLLQALSTTLQLLHILCLCVFRKCDYSYKNHQHRGLNMINYNKLSLQNFQTTYC